MARADLLQGTLDLLILKVLSLESMHGWGVGERLRQMSDEVFEVNQGSLYPALQRLKRRGLVTAEWRRTEENRRARYYELTPDGERALEQERGAWRRSSRAVDRILDWAT